MRLHIPVRRFQESKLAVDTAWNYGALAVLAASGVVINLIIASKSGAPALGVFNQVYAVFVVASQLAVFGIHQSALKHTAEFADEARERRSIAVSAILVAAGLGTVAAAVLAAASGIVGDVLGSPEVGRAVLLAAPGLAFFALNKVMLAVLNGRREMKAFAVGQGLRYLLMLAFVGLAIGIGWPTPVLGLTFPFAEGILAVVLGGRLAGGLFPVEAAALPGWIKRHLAFGMKGLLSGLLIEINARVDVLMVGLFLSDHAVGVYSLAAMLAEGFFQLLVVVRNNVNPLLVPLLKERRLSDLHALVRRVQRYVYPGILGAGLVMVAIFPGVVSLFLDAGTFMASWPLLAVLAAGMIAYSGFAPFDAVLVQAGLPGWHSLLMALNVAANVVLNAALIPLLGAIGAAAATAMALVLGIANLHLLTTRKLGFALRG